jgi:carbon-monoxide dehydrogenase large subunit
MVGERGGPNERWIGRPVKRREDPRLIAGRGQFIEDLNIPNMADVVLVRSIHAHARILSIETEAAKSMPGVIVVITAGDLAGIGSVPVSGDLKIPPHPPLASDIVRFVGDPIAAIVAENRGLAIDALDRVVVEYEPLRAVVDAVEAAMDAIVVHEEFGTNIASNAKIEMGDVDSAFAAADRHLTIHAGHGRVAAVPIETRGGIASFEASTGQFTLWLSTQAAWTERSDLAAALHIPDERIRVITPDVGGAFGAKMTVYRESILLLALARLTGRPVRWTASRSEDLQSSMHGRDAVTDGEVAFDNDGTIRGIKLKTTSNFGAYLMKLTAIPPLRIHHYATGAYTIANLRSEIVGVFTHTGPTGPYRGAGRPEAALFTERVMSEVAHALDMDQAEIRRRNFIPSNAFPYPNAGPFLFDSGNYELALDRALEAIDYERVKRDIAQRRARGEVLGVGFASCIEVTGGGSENGRITVMPDGSVRVVTGTSPHGQGHETTFSQIIADQLSVPFDSISIHYGDTAVSPRGTGTMGSRSLQVGGNALHRAALEVRSQLLETAAGLLEASVNDLVMEDGAVRSLDLPGRTIAIGEIVQAYLASRAHVACEPSDVNEGITVTAQFEPVGPTFPFGTTIVVVAIDRETGEPTIERFVSVDDVGNVINPLLFEGQVVGGIVQGMGETLWEQIVYDGSGQLISGTLSEYAVPKARWLPRFELSRTVTPSPNNPLGVKGGGETGTVHTPAAIANAIMDALRPFGVEQFDLPITPPKIWAIMNG